MYTEDNSYQNMLCAITVTNLQLDNQRLDRDLTNSQLESFLSIRSIVNFNNVGL